MTWTRGREERDRRFLGNWRALARFETISIRRDPKEGEGYLFDEGRTWN